MSELRLITAPSIYLVGSPGVDAAELGRFLADGGSPGWRSDAPGDGELLAEVAGRLCYMSFSKQRPGGNAAYIGHILDSRHGSVCEHAVYSFIITGISRSLSHELIRHRAGMSYSQLSQRFVDESDVAFVVPPAMIDEVRDGIRYLRRKGGDVGVALAHHMEDELPEPARAGFRWAVDCRQSLNSYRLLGDYLSEKYAGIADGTARRKAAREAARSVLPNCTETKIFVTGNARSIRNLCEQRGAPEADAEIRRLAVAWCRIMKAAAPNLFGDFAVQEDAAAGSEYLTFDYRKV